MMKLNAGDFDSPEFVRSIFRDEQRSDSVLWQNPELAVISAVLSPGLTKYHDVFQQADGLAGLDWNGILAIARRHQISAILYDRLPEKAVADIPQDVRSEFRSQYREAAVYNRYRTAELCDLATSFSNEDIRYISYKGPALAQTAYNDLTARQFADLDILVAPEDLTRAATILERRGYVWQDAPLSRPEELITGERLVPPLTYEWKFEHRDHHLVVELGWQLHTVSTPISLTFDTLWRRREAVTLPDGTVQTLSPADQLLVLAHHGATHRWGELKWIRDVAAVVSRGDLPRLESIVSRAETHGVARRIRIALALSAVFFSVPDDSVAVKTLRRDRTSLRLASDIIAQYIHDPLYEPSKLAEFRFRLRAMDTFHDQVLGLTEPFLPKLEDYRWAPLPGWLFPMYYLVRPVRLAQMQTQRLLPSLFD